MQLAMVWVTQFIQYHRSCETVDVIPSPKLSSAEKKHSVFTNISLRAHGEKKKKASSKQDNVPVLAFSNNTLQAHHRTQ